MRLYIAGPMTGYPEFNYPAFEQAARRLIASGFEVASPHTVADGAEHAWEWYMRRTLRMLLDCDAVALLPGWEMSKGASAEHQTARTIGMECRPLQHWLDAGAGGHLLAGLPYANALLFALDALAAPTLEDWAESANVSRSTLRRAVLEATGKQAGQVLRVARIAYGLDTGATLTQAAEATGYSDAFTFSRACKDVLGHSPAELRGMDWRAVVRERLVA